ncbi:MAG: PDDEXK nuclease domain-containing protein [Pseudomonadota bacterium]
MTKALTKKSDLAYYGQLLDEIKNRIRQGQTRAMWAANSEMLATYWDVGWMISERQDQEGWGAGVLPRLAKDLHNELPEIKGFSVTNLKLMVQFYKEYQGVISISQRPVGQLQATEKGQPPVAQLNDAEKVKQLVSQIPWAHNIVLMQKIKDLGIRYWYMQQVLEQGWSRDVLVAMIKSSVHKRHGKATSNFKTRLPAPQSDLVQQTLKDPYIFDFMTLEEPFHERELETGLIKHLEKFLIELGQGFAFVGRQYHVEVSENDFYIDLLFYHLKLRSYIVIELKKGPFKPEHAGKMNFYCSVVDDKLRDENDNPTIGLILCQDRDRILAEYALRDIHKPIGVSGYELTQKLPAKLKSSLPSVKQIESELSGERKTRKKRGKAK